MNFTDDEKKGRTKTKPELTSDDQQSVLTLDVEYYQAFLDDTDISEDKKRELIETIWSIILSLVDLGFGVHPLQQARGSQDTHTDQCLSLLIKELSQKEPEGTKNNENNQRHRNPESKAT